MKQGGCKDLHGPATERPMSPEMAVASAIASVRMEGLPVSAEQVDLLRRYAAGEITAAEARAEILARYRRSQEGI